MSQGPFMVLAHLPHLSLPGSALSAQSLLTETRKASLLTLTRSQKLRGLPSASQRQMFIQKYPHFLIPGWDPEDRILVSFPCGSLRIQLRSHSGVWLNLALHT